jgi:CRP-like cAMP-binding protein
MSSAKWALEAFIERLGELAPLSRDDIAALRSLPGEAVRLRGNVDIELPGQGLEYSCLVATGLVARFAQLADGRRQFTALHIPGDMADIHRVATAMAGSALQTLTTTMVVRVPAKSLRSVALNSPTITQAFWAYSTVDAAILAQWAVNLGRRDAKARTAHFLCEMSLRSEYSGQGVRNEFLLEASQGQIGDTLGLTAVHVNRTFKALKQSKVLSIDGRIIRVHDWALMAAIGDFDPDYLQLRQLTKEAA